MLIYVDENKINKTELNKILSMEGVRETDAKEEYLKVEAEYMADAYLDDYDKETINLATRLYVDKLKTDFDDCIDETALENIWCECLKQAKNKGDD